MDPNEQLRTILRLACHKTCRPLDVRALHEARWQLYDALMNFADFLSLNEQDLDVMPDGRKVIDEFLATEPGY